VRAHITNYRSVEDSGEFAVEPDVTCLVGKNESGKTADLQALYRVNPVDSSVVFDEVIDFPSRLTRQRKQTAAGKTIPAVTATFRLADGELATIENDLGAGALTSREFTVTTGYRYSGCTFDLRTDDAAIVRHLASELDVALGAHPAAIQAEFERRRDRLQRHPGTGDERFQQHVAGTRFEPAAAGRRMQPGLDQRPPSLDLAGDRPVGKIARRPQRDERSLWPLAVSRLERRLQFAQCRRIHSFTPAYRHPGEGRDPSRHGYRLSPV